MIRIILSITLLGLVLGITAGCSSTMSSELSPRPQASYRMGPSGAPGELPPGVN
jgi:hypothetical protein